VAQQSGAVLLLMLVLLVLVLVQSAVRLQPVCY
jgi:hypothetical protein